MRHKYATRGIVLARYPVGEASIDVALLTEELGLVRARAQSVRKPGAKLASALQTLAESDVILVRGKERWRLSGAVLATGWSTTLSPAARTQAGRVTSLLLRLAPGETLDPSAYVIVQQFLGALTHTDKRLLEAAECLAALLILRTLGLDAGTLPVGAAQFALVALEEIERTRGDCIARVNRGIEASGL